MGSTDKSFSNTIQMEEFVRKYVSRRLLALCEGEIAAFTALRQRGVGSHGGAKALAIFHQLMSSWTRH